VSKREIYFYIYDMLVHHYTDLSKFRPILDSNSIKVSRYDKLYGASKPAVWFSSNPIFEISMFKGERKVNGEIDYFLTPVKMAENIGLIRLSFNRTISFHTWAKYKHEVKKDGPELLKGLEDNAIKHGSNPNEWYACFSPVSLDKVVSIGIYIEGTWEEASDENFLKALELAKLLQRKS